MLLLTTYFLGQLLLHSDIVKVLQEDCKKQVEKNSITYDV